MKLLQNKVAIITGGTRGIGKAIALKYAGEGCRIAFTGRSDSPAMQQTLAEIEAACRAAGVSEELACKAYVNDSTDFTEVDALVKKIVEDFGHIDILVNNAGITKDTLMLRMSEQVWDDVVDTNLKGAFNFTHACVPFMARQRSGSLIYMSSVVAQGGNAGQANYAASKAGLIGLSHSMAKEFGARGIRANCITPGLILTDMTAALGDKVIEDNLQYIPLKRAGKPEEVAGAALFLASDLSSYVTGSVISCDGGRFIF